MPIIKLKKRTIKMPYTKSGIRRTKAYQKTKRGRYLPDWLFNKKQLIKGIREEYEHTSSRRKAKNIAKDHLHEHKRYYTYLERMEKKLKSKKKRKYTRRY